jgi:predicted RecA/RadA family phage recombinase
MKNFVQKGGAVNIAAPYAVVGGSLVRVGVLCGVAVHDAASGADVTVALEGVFDLEKTSAQAWTVGAAIYMVPATRLCTTVATAGNLLIGVALAAASNPSATGTVRLNAAAPAAVAP